MGEADRLAPVMKHSEPHWQGHCAEFAAREVGKSGRDIWAELGGCPRSWREAADLYRRLGCRSLAEVVTIVLGAPNDPRKAMRGDIVMIDGALGVCRGELAEFLDGMQPMTKATAAWSSR